MDYKQAALVKTIAILLSVTPETPLGNLLNVCLASQVTEATTGIPALAMAEQSIETGYHDMIRWIKDVIDADSYKTQEEDEAWQKCLENNDMFADFILGELEAINFYEKINLGDVQAALTTAIAILLSVTPDTPLGSLLNLCLITNVSEYTTDLNPLDMASQLIENGSSDMYEWMDRMIKADGNVSREEWKAFDKALDSPDMFLGFIDQELENINI